MKTKLNIGFTLIEIMVVVAIIGLLAAIAIPNLKRAIDTARARTCATNQKTIDAAKLDWVVANRQPLSVTPADADLFGKGAFIEHKPDCPAGGTYALGTVEEPCTCDVPRHARR